MAEAPTERRHLTVLAVLISVAGIPNFDVAAWAVSWAVVGSAFVLSRVPAFRATARVSPAEGLRGL